MADHELADSLRQWWVRQVDRAVDGAVAVKIVVTGAAGRLGSEVCRRLSGGPHETRGTDMRYRDDLPVPLTVANLMHRESCYGLLEGAGLVVHLGNHPSPFGRNAQTVFNENVTMNMNVLQAAAELGVKRVVFASSVQAIAGTARMGDADRRSRLPYLPLDGDVPSNPGNTYALSKAVTERMLRYYSTWHGMDAVAIRFPLLVGKMVPGPQPGGYSDWTNLDEGFSYLPAVEAADLIARIVDVPLPGYRAYFPALRENFLKRPAEDVAREFYPGVPRRTPARPLDALVDVARITAETGWSPSR
jgi:nucleoside-diphosphate-sugar epimerase